jgi:ubiquinone/menaquinone biosynthesis C-methylase UbiE
MLDLRETGSAHDDLATLAATKVGLGGAIIFSRNPRYLTPSLLGGAPAIDAAAMEDTGIIAGTSAGCSKVEQDLYGGPEGRLWELVAGEMLHCGGLRQSTAMANKAGLKEGQKVLDLCSGFGSSLRFLVKKFKIQGYGLDVSPYMVDQATQRARSEGLARYITYQQGNVYQIPWQDNTVDVVWGEDAWCYLDSKEDLIKEAVRVVKPGGVIAFSDWMTGPSGMTAEEATRIHSFMKFPYTESVKSYEKLLEKYGMRIKCAEDLCDQFSESMELYCRMISEQLTYDALRILGDNSELLDHISREWGYMIEMGRKGKFGQGRIVAVKS